MSGEPCAKCGDTGAASYVEESSDPPRHIGNGIVVEAATTYGTRLCGCRESLPPLPGRARWWDTVSVYEDEFETAVLRHNVSVSVCGERPISAENYIVEKRGNRYYPTTINIDASENWIHWLSPEEARKIAAMLTAAADAADAYDEPDVNEDGTWWFPAAGSLERGAGQ